MTVAFVMAAQAIWDRGCSFQQQNLANSEFYNYMFLKLKRNMWE